MQSRLPNAPDAGRDALIQALSEKFYIDEKGTHVSNGLSTDLIVFPSDREPRRKRHLDGMIDYAMSYATTFKDVDELNALYVLPKTKVEPDYYVALGLYLYFADECSRLRPDTTFLTELRKANATLKFGEKFDKDELAGRFMTVLKNLGMDKTHGDVLREWAANGSYTIQGDWNGRSRNATKGAYARLARDICMQQELLGMNLPISYALGNKEHIKDMSAGEAYDFTRGLTSETYGGSLDPHISDCIREGNAERRKRIHEAIDRKMEPLKDSDAAYPRAQNMRAAKEILSYLPDSTLEMLHREGYVIAYSNHSNIGKCYPDDPMPGNTAEDVAMFKRNKGDREQHYRTIFISNGDRQVNGDDILHDEHLRAKVVAQTLAHEACHNAIDYLSKKDKDALKQAAIAVGEEIAARRKGHPPLPAYFDAKLKTIDPNTLAEVLSYDSGLYQYAKNEKKTDNGDVKVLSDDRWLEVACNAFSLMQTEFPPHAEGNNPYRDLPSLNMLKEQLLSVNEKALERCRQMYHHAEMPEVSPSRTV